MSSFLQKSLYKDIKSDLHKVIVEVYKRISED
jgi:hypothetical protein